MIIAIIYNVPRTIDICLSKAIAIVPFFHFIIRVNTHEAVILSVDPHPFSRRMNGLFRGLSRIKSSPVINQFAPFFFHMQHGKIRKISFFELLTEIRNLGTALYEDGLGKERVAIIGENGKGKSTLLKTLMGQIPPLGGSYTIGTGVEVGYFDQQAAVAESMYPDKTVLNDFWDMYPTLKEVEVRNALGSFLSTGEEVFKTLGQLSG